MKTISTLLFVLFISVATQAQEASEIVQKETSEITVTAATSNNEINFEKKTEVARLYKFKNSRIKRALSFTTKKKAKTV